MKLDFETLVENYTKNLQDTLRNFAVGPDFLDTWVHDEDIHKSVAGIFDAAEIGNFNTTLTLVFDKKNSDQLDTETLKNELSKFGQTKVESQNGQILLSVDFSKKPTSSKKIKLSQVAAPSKSSASEGSKEVADNRVSFDTALGEMKAHPCYQDSITAASKSLTHEGELKGDKVWTNEGLTIEVNEQKVIVQAKHSGQSGLDQIILDQFCQTIEGLSVQEASEHGVIRLESRLRNHEFKAPVTGILTPENADPCFLTPLKAIREIYKNFSSGTTPERNFWVDPVDKQWLVLPENEKMAKAQKALIQSCKFLGLQTKGIEVVGIKSNIRLILAVIPDVSKPAIGPAMIRLETEVARRLTLPIELMLESREDTNKRHSSRKEESTTEPTASA